MITFYVINNNVDPETFKVYYRTSYSAKIVVNCLKNNQKVIIAVMPLEVTVFLH